MTRGELASILSRALALTVETNEVLLPDEGDLLEDGEVEDLPDGDGAAESTGEDAADESASLT